VFGLAAAVTIGAEIGRGIGGLVFDPVVAPAVKFEESQFDKFVAANAGNRQELERGLAAVEGGIHDIAGNTVDGLERWLIPQLGVLEQQRDTLRELLAKAPQAGTGNFVPTNPGGTLQPRDVKQLGDRIERAEQHQSKLIERGDVVSAAKLQNQIDAMHRLRGTQDRTNVLIAALRQANVSGLSMANRRLEEGNRAQRVVAARVDAARQSIGSGFSRSNSQLGVIARKKTSFSANVTNNITAYLSAYQAIQTTTRINRIRTDFAPGDSTGGSL
jgi:hypothetical protein